LKNTQEIIPDHPANQLEKLLSDNKQEVTRLKRLNELIASCEAGQWIKGMQWGKKNAPNSSL